MNTTLMSALEAVLFAYAEPLDTLRIAQALELSAEETEAALEALSRSYAERQSGIAVRRLGKLWQMSTEPQYGDIIRRVMETKRFTPLSPAAMEVLTIAAYNQPVSKGFIEHVRGVDSGAVVNSLVDKELLEEAGRLDVPGKPIAYRTTAHFLRCFGLTSLEDLPPLPTAAVPEAASPVQEAEAESDAVRQAGADETAEQHEPLQAQADDETAQAEEAAEWSAE